ncbi:hypothetical protein Q7689_00820 [Nocardiopsis tropica]|uniref:hypothetical protein n=1 Tax=Nocardiopsis tropica TaxID=109330 RepID=UPI002E896C02|nr:hypothetical protein [Nocardiopsis tropica]
MTEYVSPTGQTQCAEDPVVQVRLRAHGWIPRLELEKVAAHNQAAAQRLALARDAEAKAQERAEQRRAAQMGEAADTGTQPAAAPAAVEPPPPPDETPTTTSEEPAGPTARRTRTTKTK